MTTAIPHIRIRPSRGWLSLHLREVWEYRELLGFLVWRDVKVRYKQTALGVVWIILQPLATTLLFTLIFGNLARLPSENLPYAVFALSGLLVWNYFAGSLNRGGSSLVGSAHLISKVYFPRLIIPITGVLSGLVDFCIVFLLLLAVMLFYGTLPTAAVVTLPLFLLVAMLLALGVGLWLSALNVRYRDVNYILPFISQFWLYATPVIYPTSLIPEQWRWLYALNPMVGVVEGFRWALFGKGHPPDLTFAISMFVVAAILVSGLFFFKRMERTFADVV
jgi:lipopolysaccharide transport system permease protein